jgi:hypothetical protein
VCVCERERERVCATFQCALIKSMWSRRSFCACFCCRPFIKRRTIKSHRRRVLVCPGRVRDAYINNSLFAIVSSSLLSLIGTSENKVFWSCFCPSRRISELELCFRAGFPILDILVLRGIAKMLRTVLSPPPAHRGCVSESRNPPQRAFTKGPAPFFSYFFSPIFMTTEVTKKLIVSFFYRF